MSGKRKGPRKWFRSGRNQGGARKALSLVIAMAFVATPFVGLASAPAQAANDGVCTGLDSGKIDVIGSLLTVMVTAPEGKLISGYCVKAGSANQGDGPVYITVDPPVAELTFGHPSGKDVSHYSVSYATTPPPDQCPDGSNPGDLNGDGEVNAEDCDYTPPPPDQCPDGSNPGDLNGDGQVNEEDCGYVPPSQCPDGTNPGDVNGDGVNDEADCVVIPPHPTGGVTVTPGCGFVKVTNGEDRVMRFEYGSFGSLEGPDTVDGVKTIQSGDTAKVATARRSLDWHAEWSGLAARGINLEVSQDCDKQPPVVGGHPIAAPHAGGAEGGFGVAESLMIFGGLAALLLFGALVMGRRQEVEA